MRIHKKLQALEARVVRLEEQLAEQAPQVPQVTKSEIREKILDLAKTTDISKLSLREIAKSIGIEKLSSPQRIKYYISKLMEQGLLVKFDSQVYNREVVDISQVSDGYHTFEELYEHRNLLFSRIAEWKSKKHHDGTSYQGYFIAGIGSEPGKQITYHVPERLWDTFKCKKLKKAPEWDGHTSQDVLSRLQNLGG